MTNSAMSDEVLYRQHRLMLLFCSIVVLGALLLEVVPEGRVALRGLERAPFPHSCSSRAMLGIRCPACGLTRSTIHFANGRWRESIEVHRLGWLLALLVLAQFPYRLIALAKRRPAPLGRRLPRLLGTGLFCLFLANWIYDALVGGIRASGLP
jgi:hypothetical protein